MACFFDSVKNKRTTNEDSFCKMDLGLNHEARVSSMVVADGMGGLDAGKEYSSAAVKLWYRELVRTLLSEDYTDTSLENQLEVLRDNTVRAFSRIGRTLYKKGIDSGVRGGTTLTVVLHFWNTLLIANCGDSPVYGFRNGQVELLSEVQNAAGKMVREGKIRPGSLLYYQNKNRLLSYMGGREEVEPFINMVDSRDYDCIIVGTDGAFGGLDEEELQWVFGQITSPGTLIRTLFDSARAKGEDDNQTAIVYFPNEETEVPEKGLPETDSFVLFGDREGLGEGEEEPVIRDDSGIPGLTDPLPGQAAIPMRVKRRRRTQGIRRLLVRTYERIHRS